MGNTLRQKGDPTQGEPTLWPFLRQVCEQSPHTLGHLAIWSPRICHGLKP